MIARLKWIAPAALVAAGAFLWWRADHLAGRLEAVSAERDQMRERVTAQAQALRVQRDREAQLLEVERGIESLRQTLIAQGVEYRADLEELKRNDKAVREYLRGGVPHALGVRYQRPDTTDPARYRRGAGVPADAVPPAGSAGAGDE